MSEYYFVIALNDKYDSLRDKLLLDSLMNQYGKAEWDRLSEQERQSQLAKMRMLEKKLRREGKYDELSKLLGDAASNSDALGVRIFFYVLKFKYVNFHRI